MCTSLKICILIFSNLWTVLGCFFTYVICSEGDYNFKETISDNLIFIILCFVGGPICWICLVIASTVHIVKKIKSKILQYKYRLEENKKIKNKDCNICKDRHCNKCNKYLKK